MENEKFPAKYLLKVLANASLVFVILST